MIKIFRVILPVADIVKATTFYRELLGQVGERVSPGRHYFDCGGVILACYDPRSDGDGFDAQPNPDHVYFAVTDIDAMFKLARRLDCQEIEQEVMVRPWGERSFYFKDPFGNPICFVEERTIFTGKRGP